MGKHTPEPWAVHQDASGDVFISSAVTSFHIAEVGSEDDETVFADANRIVACVNFCAGISTVNLEGNEKLLWLAEQYNAVKSQRDALSSALEEARTGLIWYQENFPTDTNGSDDEAMARIDAALEQAKGEQ